MQRARQTSGVFRVLTCSALLGLSTPALAQTVIPSAPISGLQSPPSGRATTESVGTLLHDTVKDFGNLASLDTLKWLGIGAGMAIAARPVDQPTSIAFSSQPSLDRPFDAGQTLGGARVQLVGALATYGIGRITGSPLATAVGSDLLQAQIVSQTLTAGIKMAARRTRPDGTQYSFPSGHSSVTFASATVLQRYFGWKVGAAAYGVATYVAASRIQEQRHFLSDVAFGAAIGILAGRTVTIGSGERRFAVSPMATPGGGGVSFTLVGRP